MKAWRLTADQPGWPTVHRLFETVSQQIFVQRKGMALRPHSETGEAGHVLLNGVAVASRNFGMVHGGCAEGKRCLLYTSDAADD